MKKILIIIFTLFFSFLAIKKYLIPFLLSNYIKSQSPSYQNQENPYFIEKETSQITPPSLSPTPTIFNQNDSINPNFLNQSPNIIDDGQPWGVSQQIGEHTWVIKVGQDSQMATPQQILTALNEYRIRNGSQPLTSDNKLTEYAYSRAQFFSDQKKLDSHQGFSDFLNNDDGFYKLGFTALGENASFGYRLNGVHLIEWVYAGDEPHDNNQLDSRWDHVGIGVVNTATCLIFATGKI